MPSRHQRELALLITGKDVSATTALRGVKREVNSLGAVGAKAGRNLARNVERGLLLTGTAAVGALGYAVKAAADFEEQLNIINTVARQSPEALGKIGDGIRQISRDTGTTTDDLTAAYYDLVSAGIAAADAQGVLEQANTLAIGGLSSTAEAVDLLTTAINVYGGDASKAGQFTDEFAKAIERGKVTAAELAASYAQVAPLAKELGIENAELAAGYARLTASGTPAAEASTQMASALTALLKKTPALEELQKATGKNYVALAGSKGLNVALQAMRDDAEAAGVGIEELVGRKEALLYILQTTGSNLAAYNADLAAMGDAAGTAADQMGERQQGLNHQLRILRANLQDAAITIGSEVLPEFVALGKEGVSWIQDNQPAIRQFAKDLAAGIRDAVTWAKSLDWAAIGGALQTAAGGAQAIAAAFLGLPDWVKTAVITGWGLNKLTGGAVVDFGKLVFARGQTPANPMFVWQVNPAAGGLPGAGGGGKGGGIVGAGWRLLPWALAAIAFDQLVGERMRDPSHDEEILRHGFAPQDPLAPHPAAPEGFRGSLINGAPGAPGATRGGLIRGPGGAPGASQDLIAGKLLMAGAAGRHGALAQIFNEGGLTRFRKDAIGSDLFNQRVDYLRAAQGRGDTGAKGKQFDAVVSRDIQALKAQQAGASAEEKAKLQTMIDTLVAIRDKEIFPTKDLPTKADWAKDLGSLRAEMEGNRKETKRAADTYTTAETRRAAGFDSMTSAIRNIKIAPNISIALQQTTSVSVSDTVRRTTSALKVVRVSPV